MSVPKLAQARPSFPKLAQARPSSWFVCGAITNVLNALHLLGYAGKMLSGGKVRDQQIVNAFCQPGETLVGWIVAGTPLRALRVKREKPVSAVLSDF